LSDVINYVYETIDEENRDKSAATRRQLVGGAAAALGTMGLLGYADRAEAQDNTPGMTSSPNTVENIANIATTAEVLATIVNTVGFERTPGLDPTTRRNIGAAARHELIHYNTLTSAAVGGRALATRIWVPDAVFATREGLLTTLVVGDQVFINAYLLGLTVFARGGGLRGSRFARFAAEFMGVEAVHRAAALQSLRGFGNDRAFMRFAQREETPGLPTTGQPGFYRITQAVEVLQSAGFGFGQQGATPGAFYEFGDVSRRTPDFPEVRTRSLS
jgi:hypothetical protein